MTPLNPLWRPGQDGKDNPLFYMVFYGIDFDEGFPDQFDGKEWWKWP